MLPTLPTPVKQKLSGTILTFDEIRMNRSQKLGFSLSPVGAAVTSAKAQVRFHPEDPYLDDFTDADFAASSIYEVLRASATPPESTVDGGTGWAVINFDMVYSVRFVVTLAGAGSVTLRYVH